MSITKISPSVVDFDDGITISTADNTDTLTLTSTDADDNSGPNLNMYRNSSSAADADVLGQVKFTGKNDAGSPEDIVYGSISGKISDASDSTEDGQLRFFTMAAGTSTQTLTLESGNSTFAGQVIAPNGATSGYYLKQTGGTATPRITNDGNDHTIIRPGKSGGAVQYNNFANDAELMRLADDGVLTLGSSQEAKMFITSTDRFNLATADGLGIQLDKDNNRIAPVDASGSYNNNVSLGSSSLPFKDLHISGGVVFDAVAGGATSNTLDDYEEGSFTIGVSGTTATLDNTTAYYTKIGRLVYFFWYSGNSSFASSSSTATLTGLPFHQDGLSANYGLFQYVHGNAIDGDSTGGYINNNGTQAFFVDGGGYAGATFIDGSTKFIMVQGIYQTDG